MTALGQDLPMPDARERVVGTLKFTLDHEVPGMVHARTLRSPYPHAWIRAIDAEAAEAHPEVLAVITGQDLVDDAAIKPYFGGAREDQPVLAIEKVRYVGESVAVVVAETEEAAAEVLQSIDVDYEEIPHVDDARAAMREDAPTIHDQWPDNVCGTWKLRHGDIEAGWAESDRIYEDEFTSPPASHVPMEPHVAVAAWEPDESLTVWTSAQSPHLVHETLAKMFDLTSDQLSVRIFDLGGGFGAKGGTKIEPIVAYASRVLGRPVRLELQRDEVFFTVGKHAAWIKIRTGVKNDGTLVARQVEIIWGAGAYAISSPRATAQGMIRAPGPYRIPHVWVDSTAWYTNTVPTGPFRGAMTTQVCWAYESQLDDIAADLGIDPLELRRRNLLREGDAYATGEAMHDVHFLDLIEEAARGIEWHQPSAAPPEGRARGKGLAVMLKSTVTPSRSEVKLRMWPDGRVTVLSSSTEMGQGASIILIQLAADYLGMSTDLVDRTRPDTAITPYDSATASSRTTFSMGGALRDAATEMKRRLLDLASEQFEIAPADLEHQNGGINVVGDPANSKSYGDIIRDAGLEELVTEGVFQSRDAGLNTLDPQTGQGKSTVHWHQGAAGVEVEVDLETGKVEILQCHATSYAGRMVNPLRVQQQNEGCAILGVGLAFLEESAYDNGQLVNPNLSDYMIPSIKDIPRRLTSRSLESDDLYADLHGVGEMVVPAIAPAIGNALFRAVGIRLRDLPMTPERVLRALLATQEVT